MLIDLHTHSYPQSDDAFMAVDELIESAIFRGLDGVCLTDHDRFWSIDETRDLSQRHQFLVLSGSEINTDAGHVLVFGLDEYVFGLHKPGFLQEKVTQRGGAMVAAHPHRRRFLEDPGHLPEIREEMLENAAKDRIFQMCQAVEGLNGRATPVQNSFSHELSLRLEAKMTAGSDAHRPHQIGTAATMFEREITDLAGLIEELKAGRFRPMDLTDGHPGIPAGANGSLNG